MEVRLAPDVEDKLARIAAERGCDAEMVAREAVERLVNYDEWFLGEVEKGLAEIDRGRTLSHEEVGARIETLIAQRQSQS
jgi:predicted transcriptional regulator